MSLSTKNVNLLTTIFSSRRESKLRDGKMGCLQLKNRLSTQEPLESEDHIQELLILDNTVVQSKMMRFDRHLSKELELLSK